MTKGLIRAESFGEFARKGVQSTWRADAMVARVFQAVVTDLSCQRRLLHLPVEFLHKLRLIDVEIDIGRNLLVFEVTRPVDMGSHCL